MPITDQTTPLPDEIRVKMEQYCVQLLDAGMAEPTKAGSGQHRLFYRPATDLTAFIVNLTGNDGFIEVVYGYASTAFTKIVGDENALTEWGISDTNITLREKIILCDDADEATARVQIRQMYERYAQSTKDDLLNEAKAKRKAFLQQIALKLKPLGFRKKANTWTRALESAYSLIFYVQKSAFSDEYYFNVYIGKSGTNSYGDCYYARIAPPGMCPMDWQALKEEEFDFFWGNAVLPVLEEIIRTPLRELGKLPAYWSGCHCDRTKCPACWMKKNLWEAK